MKLNNTKCKGKSHPVMTIRCPGFIFHIEKLGAFLQAVLRKPFSAVSDCENQLISRTHSFKIDSPAFWCVICGVRHDVHQRSVKRLFVKHCFFPSRFCSFNTMSIDLFPIYASVSWRTLSTSVFTAPSLYSVCNASSVFERWINWSMYCSIFCPASRMYLIYSDCS